MSLHPRWQKGVPPFFKMVTIIRNERRATLFYNEDDYTVIRRAPHGALPPQRTDAFSSSKMGRYAENPGDWKYHSSLDKRLCDRKRHPGALARDPLRCSFEPQGSLRAVPRASAPAMRTGHLFPSFRRFVWKRIPTLPAWDRTLIPPHGFLAAQQPCRFSRRTESCSDFSPGASDMKWPRSSGAARSAGRLPALVCWRPADAPHAAPGLVSRPCPWSA